MCGAIFTATAVLNLATDASFLANSPIFCRLFYRQRSEFTVNDINTMISPYLRMSRLEQKGRNADVRKADPQCPDFPQLVLQKDYGGAGFLQRDEGERDREMFAR